MIVLSLGSNLGQRDKNIYAALNLLGEKNNKEEISFLKENFFINIIKVSSLYETEPVGENNNQNSFYNLVVSIETNLDSNQLLKVINYIEEKLGRKREFKNSPRSIDIDIIYYNDKIVSTPTLKVPHIEYKNRKFVLIPLSEIAPNFKDKTSDENIETLILNCKDRTKVIKMNSISC